MCAKVAKVMMRRRITIHSISKRIVMVDRATREFDVWCKDCGKAVRMVTVEQAAAIVEISPRAIYQAIEAGELHFLELPTLFVCGDSLGSRFGAARQLVEDLEAITGLSKTKRG
jgi:hypothetical protein